MDQLDPKPAPDTEDDAEIAAAVGAGIASLNAGRGVPHEHNSRDKNSRAGPSLCSTSARFRGRSHL
jgi:hypothetical protein